MLEVYAQIVEDFTGSYDTQYSIREYELRSGYLGFEIIIEAGDGAYTFDSYTMEWIYN